MYRLLEWRFLLSFKNANHLLEGFCLSNFFLTKAVFQIISGIRQLLGENGVLDWESGGLIFFDKFVPFADVPVSFIVDEPIKYHKGV